MAVVNIGAGEPNLAGGELNYKDVYNVQEAMKNRAPALGEAIMNNYLQNPVVGRQLLESTSSAVREVERQRKEKPKLHIPAQLDASRRQELERCCAAFDVEFTSTDAGDHFEARASSAAVEAIIFQRFLYKNQLREDVKLKMIGENPDREIERGSKHHNCLAYDSTNDARDRARRGALLAKLTTKDYSNRSPEVRRAADDYLSVLQTNKGNKRCCNKLFQYCDEPGDAGYARDVHDISPRQVATGMARSGMSQCIGTLMYHPSLFFEGINRARLPFTNYVARIDRKKDEICFRGPSDTQDQYAHRWSVYSSWFLGSRLVTVKHGSKMYRYEFTFVYCGMDKAVWRMVPVSNTVTPKKHRVLPFPENSEVVACYGYSFDIEHEDYNSFMKPRKRDLMTTRVEFVPAAVYDDSMKTLYIQKKEFTSEFANRAIMTNLRKRYDNGIVYSNCYPMSADAVGFVGSHMYMTAFDSKFNMTQGVAESVKQHLKFRGRFDKSFVSKLLKALTTVNTPDGDLQISDETGKVFRVPAHRARLFARILQSLTSSMPKKNILPLKPLLFNRNTTLMTEDTDYGAMLLLTTVRCGIERALMELSKKAFDRQLYVFPRRYLRANKELADITVEPTHSNSCLFDAFAACMDYEGIASLGYFEIARSVLESDDMYRMTCAKEIVQGISQKTAMPVDTLHLLAKMYDVTINVLNKGVYNVYGNGRQCLWMEFKGDDHIVPKRVVPENFPGFVDNIQIRDPSDLDIAEAKAFAERAAFCNYRSRDAQKTMGDDECYGDYYVINELARDREVIQVFDPEGAFCVREHLVMHTNVVWHSGVSVDDDVVKVYRGVEQTDIEDDPIFWDRARKDDKFCFDAVVFDLRREELCGEVALPASLMYAKKLLNEKGVLAIRCNIQDAALLNQLDVLNEEYGHVRIGRPYELSFLCEDVTIFFSMNGNCDVASVIEKYQDRYVRMLSYFIREFKRGNTANDVNDHLRSHYPMTALSVYVEVMRLPNSNDYVEDPREDIPFSCTVDTAVDVAVIKRTKLSRFSKALKSAFRLAKKPAQVTTMFEYEKPVLCHDNILRARKALEDRHMVRASAPPLSLSESDTTADIATEQQSPVIKETINEEENEKVIDEKPIEDEKPIDVVEEVEIEKREMTTIIPIPEMSAKIFEAVNEFVTYHEHVIEEVVQECRESHLICSSFKEADIKTAIAGTKKDILLLANRKVYRPTNSAISDKYSHVYNVCKGEIVTREEFEEVFASDKDAKGVVVPALDPYISPQIVEKYKNFRGLSYAPFEIKVIQAVSGAGKTHRIVQEFNRETDLLIQSTIQGRYDAMRKLISKNPAFEKEKTSLPDLKDESLDLVKRDMPVKTSCSQLLNNAHAARLWVDEMTQHHRGAIYLCAIMAGASEVICVGDRAQTYCFSSVPRFRFKHHKIDVAHPPDEFMTTTYRLSERVNKLAEIFYRRAKDVDGVDALQGQKLETKNQSIGGVAMKHPYCDSALKELYGFYGAEKTVVLTYTRADKNRAQRVLGDKARVCTIAQFQGSESDVVILIRTNAHNKAVGLYSSNSQLLTAVTRAKNTFVYLSSARGDILSTKIKSLSN